MLVVGKFVRGLWEWGVWNRILDMVGNRLGDVVWGNEWVSNGMLDWRLREDRRVFEWVEGELCMKWFDVVENGMWEEG